MMTIVNGNDRVAEFIRALAWDNLPPAVQGRARLCLLDGLGATLAGTLTPVSKIAANYASTFWRGDGATIFLHGRKANAAGAAFANACAGNALDSDDDAIFTRGHPGAQLIPATLAVAEKVGASGKALLEALVIGYEVAIRTGRCWHAEHEFYQACGSWGSVACAAAAAHLMALDQEQTKHALGIADYHAPNAPMMRDIAAPSMSKHAIGWGALNGVVSAELAGRGFTGIPSILGFEKYQDWIADIGQHYWMVDWVFYKDWCSCAWGHAACQAAWQLMKENCLPVEQIVRIQVRTFEEAIALHQEYPTTTEQAQFSLKWPLACLILDGEIGPAQILEDRFHDPQVRALFDKIELVLDPEIEQMYNEAQEMDLRMHSAVEITLSNGQTFDSGIVERGADRFDQAALERKFRWLAGFVLDSAKVEKTLEMTVQAECLESVRELTELLR
jgi:2-methylcitrate dehydratase PrpD